MRSFISLLLFENIFDNIPNTHPDVSNLANTIFTPNLMIVEEDCGTTLGTWETLNFESQGLVELATGERLVESRIEQLLSQGVYNISVHNTNTCISKNGVCAKCFASTFPDLPVPNVLDRVNVLPEYLVNAEIIPVKIGATDYTIQTDPDTFTKMYLFNDQELLTLGVDYSLNGRVLTLNTSPVADKNLVLRCMKLDSSPFLNWLAKTYAGSILGLRSIVSPPLPVRTLLLSSLLTENRLQLVSEQIKSFSFVPPEYAEYMDIIQDPLEKALYMLALYSIYSNVVN